MHSELHTEQRATAAKKFVVFKIMAEESVDKNRDKRKRVSDVHLQH